MRQDDQVSQLLKQLLDSGSTLDEVCFETPHLLPAVRRRWEQFKILNAELCTLFPSSHPKNGLPPEWGTLPDIPGYKVEEILGHGGVGVVYRARQLRLDRTVALKMLLSGAYADRLELARFRREAKTIAGLHHANIVQIYEVGELDSRPYFTMEYLEGGSLAQKLGGVPQSSVQATAVLSSIAQAIESAHRSGIIHRDLKPANILLTADGVPKISDFGLRGLTKRMTG